MSRLKKKRGCIKEVGKHGSRYSPQHSHEDAKSDKNFQIALTLAITVKVAPLGSSTQSEGSRDTGPWSHQE